MCSADLLALSPSSALFLGRVRGGIPLECPQGPLNLCQDVFAVLGDRDALGGQNLPILEQVIELRHSDLVQQRRRDSRSNVICEMLLGRFPFGRTRGPGKTMDTLSHLGQKRNERDFLPCSIALQVAAQGMHFFFQGQRLPCRGFHLGPKASSKLKRNDSTLASKVTMASQRASRYCHFASGISSSAALPPWAPDNAARESSASFPRGRQQQAAASG